MLFGLWMEEEGVTTASYCRDIDLLLSAHRVQTVSVSKDHNTKSFANFQTTFTSARLLQQSAQMTARRSTSSSQMKHLEVDTTSNYDFKYMLQQALEVILHQQTNQPKFIAKLYIKLYFLWTINTLIDSGVMTNLQVKFCY